MLQKKAIRIVTNSAYHAHTAPLFNSMKLLPYQKIVQKAQLLLMHSIHYKYVEGTRSLAPVWRGVNDFDVNYLITFN